MSERIKIVLDEVAVADLNEMLGGFRHADALALIGFLNRRARPAVQPGDAAIAAEAERRSHS